MKTKDWRIDVLSNLKKDVFDYRYIDEQLINEITSILDQLNTSRFFVFAHKDISYTIGKEPIVKLILKKNFKSTDKINNWTALQYAAYNGYYATAKSLIVNGAGVNFKEGSSLSALDLSCSKGHIDLVYLLLQHGANITHTTLSICKDIRYEIGSNKREVNHEIIVDLVQNTHNKCPIHTRVQ